MTPRERAEALFSVERVTGSRWDVWHASGRCVGAFWTEEAAKKAVEEEAAPIAAAIESALAEQAAGEAERVREAVAAERAAMLAHVESEAKCYREHGLDGAESALGIVANWLRARATSPAPEPVAAERAVVERLAKLFDEAVVVLGDAAETIDQANEIMSDECLLDEEDDEVSSGVACRCRGIADRIAEALAAARKGGSR